MTITNSRSPPAFPFKVEIELTLQPTDDYDLEVYGPNGSLVGQSANSAGQAERVVLTNPRGRHVYRDRLPLRADRGL